MKIYEFVKNNKATYKKDEICFVEIIHISRMAIKKKVAISHVFFYFTLNFRTISMCSHSMKSNCVNLFGNFLYIP